MRLYFKWIISVLIFLTIPFSASSEEAITFNCDKKFHLEYAEFSGMAFAGDYLVLLPQYPGNSTFEKLPWGKKPSKGCLFYIKKKDILEAIFSYNPLKLYGFEFDLENGENLKGKFQGYEAIAFEGDKVFLTVEMEKKSYLIEGTLKKNKEGAPIKITLDLSADKIEEFSQIVSKKKSRDTLKASNSGEETLVFIEGKKIVFHERRVCTGKSQECIEINESLKDCENIDEVKQWKNFPNFISRYSTPNNKKQCFLIDLKDPYCDDRKQGCSLDFDRITDATQPDSNEFWVITRGEKYFFINRLSYISMGNELRFKRGKQMRLSKSRGYNWEGIVRIDSPNGFLVVVDANRNPNRLETSLCFKPFNGSPLKCFNMITGDKK